MPKFFEGYADKLVVPKGSRDVLVFDTEVAGLGIRKFASGEASYILKYPVGGKVVNGVAVPSRTRRVTLEEVQRGRLAAVRKLAQEVKSRARVLGEDLLAEREAAAARAAIPKLGELVAPYLAARQEGGNDDGLRRLRATSMRMVRRYLEVLWKPLHKLRLDEITPKHVKEELKTIAGSSGLASADRARAALSVFFVWAIHQEYVGANPTLDIKDKSNSRRSRVLSEGELVYVWKACGDDTYGPIVKLLILTGQRREEIGGLQWPEIDGDQRWIELPEERCKNHRRHLIPLSEPALAILEAMPRKEGEHVFGRHGAGPFNGWALAKKSLDKRIAVARKQAGLEPMKPWVLHDLRRAFSTQLNNRGMADPHVVEAILNHVSGHKATVAGVYNHAAYIKQKREALEAWGAHVLKLVAGRGRKVEARGRTRELA
jgi:integrase